ncbi:uncharacterized protein LOC126772645 isoform X2 [Nymphalis io]|uniref:uncharacterized protein LOC126772645 isoform X2 n=1 Tax=Inachis io TaxID=171585 RepID=UPI002168CD4E|nr:uncharacterized protein LOC126772645 isoform X2 [Nymphalis io]
MDLIICIIFHYLAQLSVSHNVTLPNNLSQLLNKLIKETENKSDNKTPFEVIDPGNASKMVYVKEKTNPKVIWQVKYEDITDKRIEDEKKKPNLFQDFINLKNINHDVYSNFMNPIGNNQKNIPNSLEYVSESIVEHITHKDLLSVNEESTTENYNKKIENFRYSDILDEINSDKNNIKSYENILNNLTKLISSKNSNDTLNMISLNKNYDRLLKEIQEIKILHQNENLKDKIILSQPLLTHENDRNLFTF